MSASMMKHELEGHAPGAMEILFQFLLESSPTKTNEILILDIAVPTPGDVNSGIVTRALGDSGARQTVDSHMDEVKALLSQMAKHFNHLKYADGFDKIGQLAEQIHEYSQELAVAKERCLQELELCAGDLFQRLPDDTQSLVLHPDSIHWERFRKNAPVEMHEFQETYCRISREIGDRLTIAATQFTALAIDIKVLMEGREKGEKKKRVDRST